MGGKFVVNGLDYRFSCLIIYKYIFDDEKINQVKFKFKLGKKNVVFLLRYKTIVWLRVGNWCVGTD